MDEPPDEAPSSVYPRDPSPQMQTAMAFINALGTRDISALDAITSDDFISIVLPQSLGIPTQDKPTWIENCAKSLFLGNGYRLDPIDIVEGPRKIWIHTYSTSRAASGEAYENEYVVMFEFTDTNASDSEGGRPKIKQVKKYMDSLYTTNFAMMMEDNTRNNSEKAPSGPPSCSG